MKFGDTKKHTKNLRKTRKKNFIIWPPPTSFLDFEKVRVVAHHLGVDFWDVDTESDEDEEDSQNKSV